MTRNQLLTGISRLRKRRDALLVQKTERAFYQLESVQARLERYQRKLANGDYTDETPGRRGPKIKFQEDRTVFYQGKIAQVIWVIDENTVIIHQPGSGEIHCTDAQNELTNAPKKKFVALDNTHFRKKANTIDSKE